MLFEQLFDTKSSTYTYIISSGKGREALIIDPVIDNTDEYIKVLENLELKLVKVIDTHIHADHISGLNELCKRTNCKRIMGEKSKFCFIKTTVSKIILVIKPLIMASTIIPKTGNGMRVS